MSFKITFEPLNKIEGVEPKTVEIDTAIKAWSEVHGLMASDERVSITEDGRSVSWEELRDRASRMED